MNGPARICTLGDPATRSLWFDATLSDREFPRLNSLRWQTFYFDSTVTSADLTRRMRPLDVAFGPGPGEVSVVRVAIQGGWYFVVSSASWGVDTALTVTQQHYQIEWVRRNLPPDLRARTAAGAARKVLTAHMPPDAYGLHPRWRRLAHAAVHGGPAVCVSGGGYDVVQIDIKAAYCTAMLAGPVPLYWGSVMNPRNVVDASDDGAAVIEATVRVPARDVIGWIPPLPVTASDGGVVHPYGVVRGAWTVKQIREALAQGVQILDVHQAMVGIGETEWLVRAIESLDGADPVIRKYLYTRAYGVMASRGGWTAQTMDRGEMPTWTDAALDLFTPTKNAAYRPDIAAIVTGMVQTELFRALNTLDPVQTVAVHVDAIWTSDADGANRLVTGGGRWRWAEKSRGSIRYWHPGVYDVSGSGSSEEPRGSARGARVWAQAASWERRDAVSIAPRSAQDVRHSPIPGPPVQSPLWSDKDRG